MRLYAFVRFFAFLHAAGIRVMLEGPSSFFMIIMMLFFTTRQYRNISVLYNTLINILEYIRTHYIINIMYS